MYLFLQLRQLPFTSDMLLNVLRTTDSVGELQGISEMLNKDIALLVGIIICTSRSLGNYPMH
jgi:hypothetical protein